MHDCYGLSESQLPKTWMPNQDMLSAQQGNSDDCGVFVMLNAFCASRGVYRSLLIPGDNVSNVYRPQLALFLLENDTFFLL